MRTTHGALALLLAGLSTTSHSQTTLDPMVVTGTRTDAAQLRLSDAVTVIDHDTIRASGATSLAELLTSRGGIEVLDFFGDGSRASLGMRGFGDSAGSNVLVLVDGQPLNQPDIGNPDIARLRLEDIERIEILEGGSALWGNQAVGGVIHIVTRQAAGASVHFERGSFEHLDLGGRASLRRPNWHVGVAAGQRLSDNYRDHNALEREHASVDAAYQWAMARAWLRAEHSDESLQTPGGLFAAEMAADRRQSAPDFDGDFSDLRSHNLSTGLRADLGGNWQFDGRASRYEADGRFKTSFRGFPSEPASQDRVVKSYNPQWTWRFDLDDRSGHLLLGADVQRADYVLSSQFGIQRNEQSVDDIYIGGLIPVSPRLTTKLAVRHSRIIDRIADPGPFAALPDGERFTHERTVGSAGINLQLSQSVFLLAGWDQVLRYPKVDEYFGSGFTPDTIGLRPQTGDNFEIGLKFAHDRASGAVVIYQLDLANEIAFDPTSFANVNLPDSRRRGVNTNLQLKLAPRLSADVSVSHVDAELRGGGQIPLVAELHGQISLRLAASDRLELSAQALAADSRAVGGDTDGSSPDLPGYGVLNLGARWRQDGLELGLTVNNVLDREYVSIGFEDGFTGAVSYFPMPGVHARLRLRYAF